MKQITALAIMTTALFSFDTQACGLDEVGQLQQFKTQLGNHLNANNTDTRFIVNRNDKGAFSQMQNVGVIHQQDPNDSTKDLLMGTATVINSCYALTSYHVVEGRDVIDGTKMPEKNKQVKFSYGAKAGTTGGFSNNSINATVVDPGILNLNNRKWSNDVVLVRFSKKLKPGSYEKIELASPFRNGLNSSDATAFDSQFFVAAGYPATRFNSFNTGSLYADFCNPKSKDERLGINTNCVLTKGMSGGPLFIYEKNPTCNSYSKKLVALNIQPAIGYGKFAKNSNYTSQVVGLSTDMIKKINGFTDKDLDENCR